MVAGNILSLLIICSSSAIQGLRALKEPELMWAGCSGISSDQGASRVRAFAV